MLVWLASKLVTRDGLAVLGVVLGLQLVGVDVIGPAIDFVVSYLPDPSLKWVW